jgi:hypothetical protein
MLHENVLFGYDYDDETNTLITKDWIRSYGFFSTFTLLITSLMAVYKQFGVLVDNIDSSNMLYLLKRDVPLDYDIYQHFFKIDKDYKLPEDYDISDFNFGPNHHHTIYKEEHLKYFLPFVKKYFNFSDLILERSEFLKSKYNIVPEKTISVIYRDSDKWTDLGTFLYVTAGAYLRMVYKIKEIDPGCDFYIQTENEGVKTHLTAGHGAKFIEETKTGTTSTSAPLIHFQNDILEWGTNYVSALNLHSKSKYLITYTGNSAFFLYLFRGNIDNFIQEKTFEMDFNTFFTDVSLNVNKPILPETSQEPISNSVIENTHIDIPIEVIEEPKVVISLTTVPERLECDKLNGVASVIHALCKLDYNNYEIHFNVPHVYKVKNKEYVIPDWLTNLQNKFEKLKVFRTEDYGPPTKIIPTIQRIDDPNTIIVVLDDDFVYNKQTILEHVKYQSKYERAAIGYDGLGSFMPKFNDGRDHFVCLVDEPTEVGTLQHYRSVSYKRGYFDQDFFDLFVGKTLSDDVLVSLYMRYKEIPLIVVPIPNHIPASSKEEYEDRIAKLQFPLDNRGYAPSDTGACDPEILKIQPRFFIPKELEDLVKYKKSNFMQNETTNELHKLGVKYETDKATSHFYTFVYDNYFNSIKENITKVCEIGIYNGGSLKMWRDYFKNATIYGLDIVPCSFEGEERIRTAVVDQSNKTELELYVDIYSTNDFNVIIDDGSHIMKDQQLSLGVLFKSLKSGGVYIIEDLHTSMDEHGDRFGYHSSTISTYNMLKNFIETGKIESDFITDEDKEYLNNNISKVEIIIPEGRTVYDSCTSLIIKK